MLQAVQALGRPDYVQDIEIQCWQRGCLRLHLLVHGDEWTNMKWDLDLETSPKCNRLLSTCTSQLRS